MAKLSSLNIRQEAVQQNKVAEVKDFLKLHYAIRINVFDPSRTEIKPLTRKYDSPVTLDDIWLHLLEEGINASDTMLRKILRSPNQMQTYNPIKEYFESLEGKFNGTSHIDLLMMHLRMREFPGKKKDYYQERMYRFMKKWFVATAACAIGIHQNDVALGLVHGDEGTGKTFFFEYIVPECLKNLVADPKEDGKFNLEESFATNFLVYFDEMFGISHRNTDQVKKVIGAKEIDVYLPREVTPIRRRRIASACFSSNRVPEKGGFLTSGMGYRRWLVLELESINHKYSEKVDVDQLWAEALTLLKGGFEYKWTNLEWEDFREHNKLYFKETPSSKYLKMHFDIPQNGEGQWLQPKEILQLLSGVKKVPKEDLRKINEVQLGGALTQLGFQNKSKRKTEGPRNCYYVKILN